MVLVFVITKDKIPMKDNKKSERELLPIEECRKYLKNYSLSDQEIEAIRDNLFGIVESIISMYLDDFAKDGNSIQKSNNLLSSIEPSSSSRR